MPLPGTPNKCSDCRSPKIRDHKKYQIQTKEEHQLYYCDECETYISETKHTFFWFAYIDFSNYLGSQ